jgi:hypothetical protein
VQYEDIVSYNGHTVVIDVCSVVELFFQLSMLMARPIIIMRVSDEEERRRRRRRKRRRSRMREERAKTYSTPPGCRAVLFTRWATIVTCDRINEEEFLEVHWRK